MKISKWLKLFKSEGKERIVPLGADSDKAYILQSIAEYICIAVDMYSKITPHKSIDMITLTFSKEMVDRTEPLIKVDFDSAAREIVIGDLWQSDLPLDREMRNECMHRSEAVWFEYRSTADTEQLQNDMQLVCEEVMLRYPKTKIKCVFE